MGKYQDSQGNEIQEGMSVRFQGISYDVESTFDGSLEGTSSESQYELLAKKKGRGLVFVEINTGKEHDWNDLIVFYDRYHIQIQ
ncbi:hypothetical protein ABD91_00820 [Lysinibacillus sphaericus]|uniref:hypothetical protein n=1 Tax=Lysinibacillus sphaericus TaxID=1421 RepID=UPI0018CFCD73|nr:hypothetical protein [Lysinibacillus sphaericus]MBG9689469.1 hypothetical protein [Lysinibacillus sphaericus]